MCSGSPKSLLRYLIYEELDVSIGFMSHISKGKHVKSTSESWVKVLHFERKLSSIFLQSSELEHNTGNPLQGTGTVTDSLSKKMYKSVFLPQLNGPKSGPTVNSLICCMYLSDQAG